MPICAASKLLRRQLVNPAESSLSHRRLCTSMMPALTTQFARAQRYPEPELQLRVALGLAVQYGAPSHTGCQQRVRAKCFKPSNNPPAVFVQSVLSACHPMRDNLDGADGAGCPLVGYVPPLVSEQQKPNAR